MKTIAKSKQVRSDLLKLFLGAVLLGLAGCFPTQLVVWSPDGSRAALITEAGLFFSDPEGQTSELLIPAVRAVAWFSDSQRLAVVRQETFTNWTGLAQAISPELRAMIEQKTEEALARSKASNEKESRLQQALAFMKQDKLSDPLLNACELFARDQHPDATGADQSEPTVEVETSALLVARVNAQGLAPGPVLAHELGAALEAGICHLRVAPGDEWIAYSTMAPDKEACQLKLLEVKAAGVPQLVDEPVGLFFDWSPDGQALVYGKAAQMEGDNELSLATLIRQRVIDDTGKVVIKNTPEELAGLVFNPFSKIKCLRDGRIIFSSAEYNLPATVKDLPQHEQLFALDPRRQATLTRLIPQEALQNLPSALGFFEVSPDEQRIAFAGDKGEVSVFQIASGEVEMVQRTTEKDTKSLPCWRSKDELCYIAVPTKDTPDAKPEVVLRKNDKSNPISTRWPDIIREGLLD